MEATTPGSPGTEISELDDPAFLAERRRVRTLLEHIPEHEITADLQDRMRTLDDEFIRRARIAWQASAPANPQSPHAGEPGTRAELGRDTEPLAEPPARIPAQAPPPF